MFGPQGLLVFALLVLSFGAALVWLVRTRMLALKMVAGVMAFPPAMLFGVALVNVYYGYYSSWGDAWRDLTNQAPETVSDVPDIADGLDQTLNEAVRKHDARKDGFALATTFTGPQSGISRQGLIYLPPQYFQRSYANKRFPAIELIHGSPGSPNDYEGRLKISTILRTLLDEHKARPVVLVIPDSNGGFDRSSQCLNAVHGEQDETYLADDVPDFVSQRFHVMPPGPSWGIAGFSEGGFCAANLALHHPDRYSLAASLSGYFDPLRTNRTPAQIDPFAGNKALRDENSPAKTLARATPIGRMPRFWVLAGSKVPGDVSEAKRFVKLAKHYEPDVPLVVIQGGSHNFSTWRKGFPMMLQWATPLL